ncbi:TPA: hypothetical protein ACXK4S_000686 [Pseudomonas aeruginosa]
MKLITIILAAFLLVGCVEDKHSEEFKRISQEQKESYIDDNKKKNNLNFKIECVKTGSKEVGELTVGVVVGDLNVSCPEDLTPVNEENLITLQIIIQFVCWFMCVLGFFVLKRFGLFKVFAASSDGKLKRASKAVGYLLGLCSLIPWFKGISVAYICFNIIVFASIHFGTIAVNFIQQPSVKAQNVKIYKPSSLFAAPQFENLILFYESSIAINQTRNTNINFSVVDDELLAQAFYGSNVLEFSISLNTSAYRLCDEYGLNCGKDFQVQKLKELITSSFSDAEFHARKIVNFGTGVLTQRKVFESSCSEIKNYSLDNVRPVIAVAYRYRAAECLAEEFNHGLNNVGTPYTDAKAITVDLCPMAVKTPEEAASCVSQAYEKSLYAGSVATELYHKLYTQNQSSILSIYTLVLLQFEEKQTALTEAGKVFYKTLDIRYFNDVESPTYENTFEPTAFAIAFNNQHNPNLKDKRYLELLDTELDYSNRSTNGGSAGIDKIMQDILTGPDGLCGIERKDFCVANPHLSTEKYSCGSEIEEEVLFGINIAQCGIALKTLNNLGKRFSGKQRSREPQATVSNGNSSTPNFFGGLKIAAPIVAITNAHKTMNDPWSSSEFEFQQHEALYVFFWTMINNKEIRKINDTIADNLIYLGTAKAVGQHTLIAMFLIFIPLMIMAYHFSKIVSSLLSLTNNEKEVDKSHDLNEIVINGFKIFLRAPAYVIGYFIAKHNYTEALRTLNELDFSGTMIASQSILATIINFMATETIKVGLAFLLIVLFFGGIEYIVNYIYKIAFNEKISASINIEDAKETVSNSAKAIKK